tara:strand:- start:1099 stop:1263 length:165 start_codon:yes stop_codon:yes gene_type:complete
MIMELSPQATLVDRIQWYIETDDHQRAKALAQVGDFLEECYAWDVSFDGPHIEG